MAWAPLIAAGIGAAGSIVGGLISKSGNQQASSNIGSAVTDAQQYDQQAADLASQAGGIASQAGKDAYGQTVGVGNQALTNWSPYRNVGTNAMQLVSALSGLGVPTSDANGNYAVGYGQGWGSSAASNAQNAALGAFRTSPGYQFRLQQGVNALSNAGAASGRTFSGAQAKALSDYGQNTGSAEYANYINQLNNLVGQGASATNAGNQQYNQAVLPGIGMQYGGALQQGQDMLQQGNFLTQAGRAGLEGAQIQGNYGVAGNNALASGFLGAGNSIASGAMAFPWNTLGNTTGGGASGIPGGPGIYANPTYA